MPETLSLLHEDLQHQTDGAGERRAGPVRILHVVGAMNRAGVETWLMHVLRHIDRERYRMDFLVHTDRPGDYDEEIRRFGARLLVCPHHRRPWAYARRFRQILRECGPFDVVHSHVHLFSGFVLRLASAAGIPLRIAHSHSDTTRVEAAAGVLRRGYRRLMRRWIRKYATVGLACSRKAAAALFGPDWERDGRWRVHYCGIDLEPFRQVVDRLAVRAEFGIPPDAWVLGHVGRFHPAKNHSFLVEIAAEVARCRPDMRLLLVGDGPLRPQVEQRIAALGIADKVILAGRRPDVPRLLLGAMDVFVFPSHHEGLPLVVLEAQAAGLPVVMSDQVTDEVCLIEPLVRRLSLQHSAEEWARSTLVAGRLEIALAEARERVAASAFNIRMGVATLSHLYASSVELAV
ncbi:MAG TPA: glycosyltransferase family 1 protein [Gemmataceae bacterium]|nr:glycosyltransferase family 1 protein [Gemmataceae bacterium]